MKINCLSCGHTVDLDQAYSDYDGQIKCFACSCLLEVKIDQGNIKSVKFSNVTQRPSAEADWTPVRATAVGE